MSDQTAFLVQVVAALSRGLEPLVTHTSSVNALADLLARLGWDTTPSVDALDSFSAVGADIGVLATHVGDEEGPAVILADVATVMASLLALQSAAAPGAPFDDPQFWNDLPTELFALLLWDDLKKNAPRQFGLLTFAGVLARRERPADPGRGRQAYEAITLDWAVLGRTAADPASWLTEQYGWGGAFEHVRFIEGLGDVLSGLGAVSSVSRPGRSIRRRYIAADNPDRSAAQLLAVSPITVGSTSLDDLVKATLLVLPLPPDGDPSAVPEGLLLWPMVSGAVSGPIDLGPAAELTLTGDLEASPLRVQLRPAGAVLEAASADFEVSVAVRIAPEMPFVLVGTAEGSRLELHDASLELAVHHEDATGTELTVSASIDKGAAIVDFGSGDGFLSDILGPTPQSVEVSGGMAWSSLHGFTFDGSADPAVHISTNLRVGELLAITSVDLAVTGGVSDAVRLQVSVDGNFKLGPIQVSIERIGLVLDAAPRPMDDPGNFGLLELSLGFLPPSGLGVAVDAGVVTGGGYLEFEPDEGRYSGAVQLEAFGIGIAATGILLTELDDADWSLILALSTRFPGLPLGFGFTLEGLGGLLGINRSFCAEVLQAGLSDGSLDAVLFPDDPVGDAPTILATLSEAFPPAAGQHIFGPTARIGWAGMLTAEVGLLVELPDPIRVALLGQLSVGLPQLEAPLVELNADVLGVLDLEAGTLAVDASLHHSHVVGFDLSGDLALRIGWLGEPTFTLAVGGFHPRYPAPAGFPSLRRVAITLDTGGNPSIGLDGYLAVTSNSLQFGAHLDFYMEVVGFSIEAYAGFDVLITVAPFGLIADLEIGATIRAGTVTLAGVDLAVTLRGPQPWAVSGRATFKLVGIKTHFSVDLTLPPAGDPPVIESVDAAALALAALGDASAWSGNEVASGVSLGEGDSRPHPAGRLEVRQSVVPLGVAVDRIGGAELEGASTVRVVGAKLATAGGGQHSLQEDELPVLKDWFAPGQFFDLDDEEKLTGPGFERLQAGVALGEDALAAGETVGATFLYDSSVVDPKVEAVLPDAPPEQPAFVLFDTTQLALADRFSAPLRAAPLTATRERTWAVAGTEDLVANGQLSTSRSTLAAAVGRDPTVQIVPSHELVEP